MDETDVRLLSLVRAGDSAALEALLARHAPSIYRFGLKMCRDPEDAKDVAQETMLAAARRLPEFRGESSISTWLYTVARSFCLKRRRTSKHAPQHFEALDHGSGAEPAAPAPAPDEQAAGHELARALDQAIASLEPMYREVLLLRDVEGLRASEVAEVLELSVEAVKSRLHRARAAVRARLEPLLPEQERTTSARASADCPDMVELFSRHLEGEIGQADCEAMQAHVASCKRCNAACESLKHTLALCRPVGGGELPEDVQQLVKKALREFAAQREAT